MHISDKHDADAIDMLENELDSIIKKHVDVLTHWEILVALSGAIGSVLASIHCPGCREQSARAVQEMLPSVAKDALKYAAERFGDQPSGHMH